MTGTTALLIGVNVVTWVGLFFGARWLMRRVRRHFEELGRVPDPIERGPYTFRFIRLTEPVTEHRVVEYLETNVALPGVLGALGLIDGDARNQRGKVLFPRQQVEVVAAPTTGDGVFDGLFDFTSAPSLEVSEALQSAEVRRVLAEIRDTFHGLWAQDGTLRVVEARPTGSDALQASVDYLQAALTRLAAAVGTAAASAGAVSNAR